MQLPGRKYSNGNSSYRYGFGGKEKSDEISGEGNAYDFDARMYNPRLGRWFSTDAHPKAFSSPYNYVQNNPTNRIDPDGKDDIHFYFVTNSITKTYGIGVNQRTLTFVTHSSYILVEKNNQPDRFYQHRGDKTKEFYPFNLDSRSGLTQTSMPFSFGLINRNDRDVHTLAKYYDASPAFKNYLDNRLKDPRVKYSQNGSDYKNIFFPSRANFNFWGTVSSTSETTANILMLACGILSIASKVATVDAFAGGGTKLMSSAQVGKFPASLTYGAPAETFIAPTSEVNSLLSQGLNRSQIAAKLGITDPAFLEGTLMRVDLNQNALKALKLRAPTGGEAGANSLFVPGGQTVGGVTEGVVNGIPKTGAGVSTSTVPKL
jgi:RHS repeat-associated protein